MQTRRRFFGEEDGEPLAEFLNSDGAQAEPIEKLFEAAGRLRDSTQPVKRQAEERMYSLLKVPGPLKKEFRKTPTVDGPKQGRERDRAKALFDINRILRRVCLTPSLEWTVRQRWTMFWTGQGATRTAARALFHFQQLALNDQLHQVKRCLDPKCSRWFFAGRPQKKFCSDVCQASFYESTQERREARREYARRIYKEAR